ncbi:hypothetical protein G5I_07037 [Acromyrmex echinatior]|uniref:Uncharacterized protein n=1 Tax=Acromyrmex echinatior TaxID=103372 RepID=F4WMQ3_ACREC|nr:hypothetical protein G5I_07037 [Acromyrmex echinatior]
MHKVVATRLYVQNAKRAAIEVETISHADEVWPITACQTMPLTIARYRASIEGLADKTDNLPLSEPQEAGRDGCFFSPFQTPDNRSLSSNKTEDITRLPAQVTKFWLSWTVTSITIYQPMAFPKPYENSWSKGIPLSVVDRARKI